MYGYIVYNTQVHIFVKIPNMRPRFWSGSSFLADLVDKFETKTVAPDYFHKKKAWI